MQDRILLFHPGTQHSYHTAEALQKSGNLGLFCTGLYYKQKQTDLASKLFLSLTNIIDQRKLNQRFSESIREELVHSNPLLESLFMIPVRCKFPKRLVEYALRFRNSLFAKSSARHAVRRGMHIVWGYDTGSLDAFSRIKDEGGLCILDQSVANVRIWEKELAEEVCRFPEWQNSEQSSSFSWRAKVAHKERLLADWVLVGSEFCKRTFSDEPNFDSKFIVIPYGADLSRFNVLDRCRHNGPLRILFVANTALRKGLPYLFEALDGLRADFRVRVIGQVKIPRIQQNRLGAKLEVMGHIPQTLLPAHYKWADVFAFPSLFEGGGMVLAESMACGAVPITTDVGNWIVRDETDGFVLPMRDPKSIREKLAMLASDRNSLDRLSSAASARAAQFSWDAYKTRIAAFLNNYIIGAAN